MALFDLRLALLSPEELRQRIDAINDRIDELVVELKRRTPRPIHPFHKVNWTLAGVAVCGGFLTMGAGFVAIGSVFLGAGSLLSSVVFEFAIRKGPREIEALIDALVVERARCVVQHNSRVAPRDRL